MADKFYELKRKYRRVAKKSPDLEAIVMDYQKNLPTSNITTNDVEVHVIKKRLTV